MKISILIPTLPNRKHLLDNLLLKLYNQTSKYPGDCEVLCDYRGKEVTTGTKRTDLVNRAFGKYIIFIDDDDDIPDYYIEELIKAYETNSDCFAINGKMTTDGAKEIKWRLSKDYDNITIKENGVDVYLRKTNHITAVKREIALKCPFPNKSNAEDKSYSDAINKFLKSEFVISLPMYHYQFSTKNKEY